MGSLSDEASFRCKVATQQDVSAFTICRSAYTSATGYLDLLKLGFGLIDAPIDINISILNGRGGKMHGCL